MRQSAMRRTVMRLVMLIAVSALYASCGRAPDDYSPEQIIAMERAAMDRWAKGDPSGYLEILAPDVTLFDAFAEQRLDNRDTVIRHYEPFRGKVAIPRYEFLNPHVQRVGDVSVLTYNFVSYNTSDEVASRWNFSQVYRRTEKRWEIMHSHASYTGGQPSGRP
jgi:ketosteroid isomerase-like protein